MNGGRKEGSEKVSLEGVVLGLGEGTVDGMVEGPDDGTRDGLVVGGLQGRCVTGL